MWRGLDGLLADLVIGLTLLLSVGLALGTVGWFGALGLGVAVPALSGAIVVVLRRTPRHDPDGVRPHDPDPAVPTWHWIVGAIAVAPVVGSWLARTVRSFDDGMLTPDTLWYHLPNAVRFLQTGSTTGIQFLDAQAAVAYFPVSTSVLHGEGIALFGSDAMTIPTNLVWLLVALAASWRIGARLGVGVATALAGGLVLAGPGMTETQPGTALNDVVGLALVLVAAAVLTRTPLQERFAGQDVVAGMALGLAVGTKVTLLVPSVALALAAVVTAPRPRWLRTAAIYLVTAGPGLYWYARNAWHTGSPVPTLDLSVGPVHLDAVEGTPAPRGLTDYLFDAKAWRDYLLPGLDDALGRGWPLVVGLALVGLLAALALGPDARARLLAAVGVVSFVGYVVMPQYIDLYPGQPYFFSTGLRYASPALALGCICGVMVARRAVVAVLPALAVLTLVSQADRVAWPVLRGRESFFTDAISRNQALRAVVLMVVGALVAGGVALLVRWRPSLRPHLVRAAAAIPLAVVLGVALIHPLYLESRYTDSPFLTNGFAWAQDLEDARIGLRGPFTQVKYPFHGADLSNELEIVAVHTPDGGTRAAATCEEWVDLLEEGRYDYVVVTDPVVWPWTSGQPDARRVTEAEDQATSSDEFGNGVVATRVFALDPDVRDRTCSRP